MYEPTYLPKMEESLLRDLRFGVLYSDKEVNVDDPNIEPLHIHEYLEIFFNIASDVCFLVNNRMYPVAHGDAVISKAKDVHVCIYNTGGRHEYFCLWMDAPDDSPALAFLSANKTLMTFDPGGREEIRGLLYELRDESDPLRRSCSLLRLLTVLNRGGESERRQIALPPMLQEILDWINESFREIRSVRDICERYFVSPATLNRWFRKYIHNSPREYLESRKLALAAHLLADGAGVTDACLGAGFGDCSHFIALFKRKFGTTPLKYKKMNSESQVV